MRKVKVDCRDDWMKSHLTDNKYHNCPICKEQGKLEALEELIKEINHMLGIWERHPPSNTEYVSAFKNIRMILETKLNEVE